jgi:hypothetical protein
MWTPGPIRNQPAARWTNHIGALELDAVETHRFRTRILHHATLELVIHLAF